MDLAERLRELATRVEDADNWHEVNGLMETLRTFATEVEGKVLVTPCEIKSRTIFNAFNGSSSTHFPAVLTDVKLGLPTHIGNGINHADALVNLQRKVDGL